MLEGMKTTLTLAVVTGSMLAAVVACGRAAKDEGKPAETRTTSAQAAPPPARTRASCDTRAEKASCTEYAVGTTLGLERSLCEAERGRFALASCPSGERLGTCTMTGGELRHYYRDDHGPTLADAQADCESPAVNGRFSTDAR